MSAADAERVSMTTPGPWEYDPRQVRLIAPEVAPFGIKTGALIWDQTCGPSPADGRLIAAAPDMLAALIEMLESCHAYYAVVDDRTTHDAIRKARAAIAKVEGRDV